MADRLLGSGHFDRGRNTPWQWALPFWQNISLVGGASILAESLLTGGTSGVEESVRTGKLPVWQNVSTVGGTSIVAERLLSTRQSIVA